jgi:hypothetical protein
MRYVFDNGYSSDSDIHINKSEYQKYQRSRQLSDYSKITAYFVKTYDSDVLFAEAWFRVRRTRLYIDLT